LNRLGKSPFGLSQDHTTEGQQVHRWYMTSPGAIPYSIVPILSMVSFQGWVISIYLQNNQKKSMNFESIKSHIHLKKPKK
jgi:predicted GTPase